MRATIRTKSGRPGGKMKTAFWRQQSSSPQRRRPPTMLPVFRSIRSGRSRCPTTGSSGRRPASPSMHRTMSGSSSAREASPTTRRRRSLNPPTSKCCVPAPPVIEFDQDGNVVQAGAARARAMTGRKRARHLRRPQRLRLDRRQRREGRTVLKFTRDGKFVMQIGKHGEQTGSNDVTRLGSRPTPKSTRRPTKSTSPTATATTA